MGWGGGSSRPAAQPPSHLATQPPSHPASQLVTQPPNRLATILCWALAFLHFASLPLLSRLHKDDDVSVLQVLVQLCAKENFWGLSPCTKSSKLVFHPLASLDSTVVYHVHRASPPPANTSRLQSHAQTNRKPQYHVESTRQAHGVNVTLFNGSTRQEHWPSNLFPLQPHCCSGIVSERCWNRHEEQNPRLGVLVNRMAIWGFAKTSRHNACC